MDLVIPLRGMSWIPLLPLDIHGMGSTKGFHTTTTIVTTMALIAMSLVAMALTFDPKILGIWVMQHYFVKWPGLPQKHWSADKPPL